MCFYFPFRTTVSIILACITRFFYGWWIIFAGVYIQFVAFAGCFQYRATVEWSSKLSNFKHKTSKTILSYQIPFDRQGVFPILNVKIYLVQIYTITKIENPKFLWYKSTWKLETWSILQSWFTGSIWIQLFDLFSWINCKTDKTWKL